MRSAGSRRRMRRPDEARWPDADGREAGRMIQIKTPDEIALMREAGLVTPAGPAAMRRPSPRGSAPASWTPSRRTPSAPRAPFPRSSATAASPARSAPRSTRRWCTGSRGSARCARATSSRWTAARSSTAGTATRPSRSGGRDRPEHQELIDITERSLWAGLRRGGGRRPAHRHRRGRGASVRATRGRTGSSTTTAGTASAPRCTRTRTCSTTAERAAARGWCPAWPWRSSRW